MSIEVLLQKDELVRALKYLSPAITMKGQGNESMIGFVFKPGGIVEIKAGADLCRTRTSVSWSGEDIKEEKAISIESHYLANALKTLGVASEVRLKIREDQRLEFLLPGNKGMHVIPIQEDEFQPIESVTDDAEVIFEEVKKLDNMTSVFKRAMVMYGLVTPAEREVAQMLVADNNMIVCSPGFYFLEQVKGYPEGLLFSPEVAEKTMKFIDQWKGFEANFKIIKTKRWSQIWGLIEVKIGDNKKGAVTGALWLFQVSIPDKKSDESNATLLRMKNDIKNKTAKNQVSIIIYNAEELSRQIAGSVSVTEDSHVTGQIKVIKYDEKNLSQKAALILTSKNAMSAESKMGIPVEVYGVGKDGIDGDIEWKVSMIRDILSIFGKNRVVLVFDPNTKRTYFTEYTTDTIEGPFEREAFMVHIGRIIATKVKPREARERKPRKKAAVIVGGTEKAFQEMMGDILEGSEQSG